MRRMILVTGASGFAGSHLLDALREDDADVVAWGRPGEGFAAGGSAFQPGVRWDFVDVLDARAVDDAVARAAPAEVYHLAGAAHVGQSWREIEPTLAVNVEGTHHLLEAMRRRAPAARVLVPSSATVYRPSDRPLDESSALGPASPYALSKLAQERLALRCWRDDGIAVVVARAFNHIGPRQSPAFVASGFARQVAAIALGQAPAVLRVGHLEPRRDLTDVRDTVRAYVALARAGTPGTVYNVCTGRATPVRELLDRLLARAGVQARVELDPALLRPNDVPLVLGTAARLQAATGWSPRIALDQTLDDLLQEWRRRLAAGPAS